jgi:hypothetical protein
VAEDLLRADPVGLALLPSAELMKKLLPRVLQLADELVF